jgi:hypothetical protein
MASEPARKIPIRIIIPIRIKIPIPITIPIYVTLPIHIKIPIRTKIPIRIRARLQPCRREPHGMRALAPATPARIR